MDQFQVWVFVSEKGRESLQAHESAIDNSYQLEADSSGDEKDEEVKAFEVPPVDRVVSVILDSRCFLVNDQQNHILDVKRYQNQESYGCDNEFSLRTSENELDHESNPFHYAPGNQNAGEDKSSSIEQE